MIAIDIAARSLDGRFLSVWGHAVLAESFSGAPLTISATHPAHNVQSRAGRVKMCCVGL
jgi:hypothetical protein